MHFRSWIRLLLVLSLVVAGCGKQKAAPSYPPLTQAQCDALGRQIEELVTTGQVEPFRKLIDFNAMIDSALDMSGINGVQRRGFRQGVSEQWEGGGGLCGQIVLVTRSGGSYVFLRSRQVEGDWRILMRLLLDGGGANYHDLIVGHGPTGQPLVKDIYILLSGEALSQTLRRGAVQMLATQPGGMLGRLAGWESDYAKNIDNIEKLSQYVRMGQGEEALKVYKSLPPTLQRDKSLLILRLQAAQHLDAETYLAAIRDYQDLHPGDAGLDLISIDGLIMQDKHDEALAVIDRLENRLGGDPYLNVLRGNIEWMRGHYARAREHVLKAMKAEPDLQMAYWTLVSITLGEKDFDGTVKVLEVLKKDFGAEFLGVEKEPIYAEFIKSAAYRKWTGGDS